MNRVKPGKWLTAITGARHGIADPMAVRCARSARGP